MRSRSSAAGGSRGAKLVVRALVILAAAALAILVGEGAHSLATGRPLLGGNAFLVPSVGRLQLTDAERAAAAIHGSGPFALACDPGVAFTLKPDSTHGSPPARVDRFGSRARLRPEPAPGSPRIVLLGDSVTFGLGVADDETMAHRLELDLAAATPAGAPSPAVFTLACPGWNVWNCARALCDHLGRLQPDVVVYTPVANDLYDSFATTESGHRSFAFDPEVGAQRPHVSYEAHLALLAAQAPLLPAADALALRLAGGLDAIPPVSFSSVTPESRRRWGAFVEAVADLDQRMRGRGGHLWVQLCFDDTFELMVENTLRTHLPQVALVPPFRDRGPADQLDDDPHPNAGCVAARARLLAECLLRQGVVGGDLAALPALDPSYRARVAALRSPAVAAAWWEERAATWRGRIGPTIDLTRAEGAHQIYGGVAADGMVGRGVWLTLSVRGEAGAAPPERLSLEIERLPPASGLYPCSLRIRLGQRPPQVLAVPPPGDAGGEPWTAQVAVSQPDALDPDEAATGCIDVLIEPGNWVLEEHEGTSRLASFRLVRARLHAGGR